MQNLKISCIKLDELNKRNIKIIEEVILEGNRNRKNGEVTRFNLEDLESEIRNVLKFSPTSDKLILKLLEVIFLQKIFIF